MGGVKNLTPLVNTVWYSVLLLCFYDLRLKTAMEIIGNYEYNPKDLIGHGAFAMVYKGFHKKVRMTFVVIV